MKTPAVIEFEWTSYGYGYYIVDFGKLIVKVVIDEINQLPKENNMTNEELIEHAKYRMQSVL